jgi:glucuronosyltransferase
MHFTKTIKFTLVKFISIIINVVFLDHPNIKVFVTQGGIQSLSEAIDAAVPLVGIPMGAEQFYNVQKIADFQIGVKLDPLTLKADDLIKAVTEVFENKR